MKKLLIITFVFMMALTGCRQIIYWKYGMHEPKQETPESIRAFLKEMNQPLTNQYIFPDSTSYLRFVWDTLISHKMFRTLIFNDAGYLSRLVDGSSCQWSGGKYILGLKRDTLYYADTAQRYQTLIKKLVPLDGATAEANDSLPYDFTLIVTWGKFIGRYNERLFVNDIAIAQNTHARIRILYINIDMQESWKLNELQALKFQ